MSKLFNIGACVIAGRYHGLWLGCSAGPQTADAACQSVMSLGERVMDFTHRLATSLVISVLVSVRAISPAMQCYVFVIRLPENGLALTR
jgi:hypothetical protein